MTKKPRICNGKRTISPKNSIRKTGQPHAKKNETLEHYLTPYKKLTWNGLKSWMNVRPETIKTPRMYGQ